MLKTLEKAARSAVQDVQAYFDRLDVIVWVERRNAADLKVLAASIDLAALDALELRDFPDSVSNRSADVVELDLSSATVAKRPKAFNLRANNLGWRVGLVRWIRLAERSVLIGAFAKRASDLKLAGNGKVGPAILAHVELRLQFEAKLAEDREILERVARNLITINTAEVAGDQLHDIKDQLLFMETPLLDLENSGDLTAKERRHVRALRAFHSRASSLASGFLQQARDNRLQITREQIDRILAGSISHFRLAAERSATSFGIVVPRDTIFVQVDKYRFIRAFHNILSNAVHFAGRSGNAAVTSRGRGHIEVIIEPRQAEGLCAVTVKDNGPGFTDLSRAGEVGYTTRHGGTGMGLAIARSVLQAHRGKLEIVSSPGSGARVTLLVPLG